MALRGLISREEVLSGQLGGRAKRAQSALTLIEAKTALLVQENRQALIPHFNEETWRGQNADYLRAVATATDPPAAPTIQQLERYASRWASLVPSDPHVRATTVHQMAEKYALHRQKTLQIQTALAIDDPEVAAAYEALYESPIESIFTAKSAAKDSVKWAWAGLVSGIDSLPPFWTAFALMITGTIGPSVLALPIAFAGVGPLFGVAILLLVGSINILTVAYVAEACARNSAIAHGSAYIGRVIRDFLGVLPAQLLRLSLFVWCCLVLFAFYNGFGAAMGNITGIHDSLWIAVLFVVGCYYMTRKALTMTVATALIIGLVNVAIILLLAFVTAESAGLETYAETFLHLPGASLIEVSLLQLVFGITFYAYCGHIAVSNCAQIVLRRDPTGRSLLWGSAVGVATVMVIYCLWVIAVNGSIDGAVLASERGTALAPLADQVGPSVLVLGAVFVILGLGMGSINYALGIVGMTREFLGERRRKSSGSGALGVKEVREQEFSGLFSQVLSLPGDERRVLMSLMREPRQDDQDHHLVNSTGLSRDTIQGALESLKTRGLIEPESDPEKPPYRVNALLRLPSDRPTPAFDALSGRAGADEQGAATQQVSNAAQPRSTWILAAIPLLPIVAIFLVSEVFFLLNLQSFTEPLNWIGGLLPPLIAGVFPALLLVASRNKGRAIQSSLAAIITSRPVVFTILAVSVASYLLHALVIWQDLVPRILALAMALGVVALMIILQRRHVFAPALLLEVVEDAQDAETARYHINFRGQPLSAEHKLTYLDHTEERHSSGGKIPSFNRLVSLEMPLAPEMGRNLRISAQTVTTDRDLAASPCWLSLLGQLGPRSIQLDQSGGAISLSLGQGVNALRLLFRPPSSQPSAGQG